MRPFIFAAGLLGLLFIQTSIALAQDFRPHTFVSAFNGNDANTVSYCQSTAPCRTLTVARDVTTDRGVITMLDPGDYEPVIIAKNLTIEGQGPDTRIVKSDAAIGAAVYLYDAAGIAVTLRNLSIFVAPAAAQYGGVAVVAASNSSLNIHDVSINAPGKPAIALYPASNFKAQLKNVRATGSSQGIDIQTYSATYRVDIVDSVLSVNGEGLKTGGAGNLYLTLSNTAISNSTGNGIYIGATAGTTRLTVEQSRVINNGGTGMLIAPTGGAKINTTIIGSAFDGNLIGIRSFPASPAVSNVTISDTSTSNNAGGIHASGKSVVSIIRGAIGGNSSYGVGAISPAAVRIGSSVVSGNTLGFSGPISSYGNNQLHGNTNVGSTSPLPPGSVP